MHAVSANSPLETPLQLWEWLRRQVTASTLATVGVGTRCRYLLARLGRPGPGALASSGLLHSLPLCLSASLPLGLSALPRSLSSKPAAHSADTHTHTHAHAHTTLLAAFSLPLPEPATVCHGGGPSPISSPPCCILPPSPAFFLFSPTSSQTTSAVTLAPATY